MAVDAARDAFTHDIFIQPTYLTDTLDQGIVKLIFFLW